MQDPALYAASITFHMSQGVASALTKIDPHCGAGRALQASMEVSAMVTQSRDRLQHERLHMSALQPAHATSQRSAS